MALSNTYRDRILAYASQDTRERYRSGEYTDADLLQLARSAGIPDPAKDPRPSEASRRSNTPSAAEQKATAERARQQKQQEARRRQEESNASVLSSTNLQQLLERTDNTDIGKGVDTASLALRGGLNRSVGAARFTALDQFGDTAPAMFPEAIAQTGNLMQALGSGDPQAIRDAARVRPIEERTRGGIEQYQEGLAQGKRVDARIDAMENPVLQTVARAGTDVLGSPSSLASIPGGAFAAIPAADVYFQEYTAARMKGMNREEASQYAAAMAATEGAISAVPTGNIGKKAGGGRLLQTTTRRLTGDILGTSLKEGGEEALTTLAQEGVKVGFQQLGNEELSNYATTQRSQDLWEDARRAAFSGMFGGAALSSPASIFQVAYENGQRVNALDEGDKKYGKPLRDQAKAEAAAREEQRRQQAAQSVMRNISMTRQGAELQDAADADAARQDELIAQQTAKEQAFRQREQEQANQAITDEERKDAEIEASYRTEELRRQAAANPGNAIAQEMARVGVTAEMVLAERRAQQPAPAPAPTPAPVAPAPVVEQPAPVPKKRGRPKKAAPAEVAQPVVEEQGDITSEPEQPQRPPDMDEDEIRNFGLSSQSPKGWAEAEPSRPKRTAEDVIAAIRAKVTSNRSAATLGKLIADGKLVIVDDASQIPGKSTPGVAGKYNGDRMYLVAGALDTDNVEGMMLEVAAHEAKHTADFSDTATLATDVSLGPVKLKAFFRNFVGQDANKRLVAAIEKDNSPIAKRAKDRARSAANAYRNKRVQDWVYQNEVATYYISEALSNKSKGLPSLARNAVSALRTRLAAVTGSDNVNVKDIEYLAKKLLEQTALTDKSTKAVKPLNVPLNMIIGPQHPRFQEQVDKGLTYIDPSDGKQKAILSDANKIKQLQEIKHNMSGEFMLSDFFDVGYLAEGYPEIATMKLVLNPKMKAKGSFEYKNNTINLNPNKSGFFEHTGIILHELQHAIQAFEGFAYGGSPEMFMDPDLLRTQRQIPIWQKAMNDMAATIGRMAIAKNAGSPEDLQEIDAYLSGDFVGDMTDPDNVRELITVLQGLDDDFVNSEVAASIATMQRLADNISDHKAKYDAAYAAAFKTYTNLQGEIDARLTQGNRNTTDEQYLQAIQQGLKWWGNGIFTPPPARKSKLGLKGTAKAWDANEEQEVDDEDTAAPPLLDGFNSIADKPVASTVAAATERAVLSAKMTLNYGNWANALKTVIGQFSGFGVLGRALGNMKELADSEAASIAYVAEGSYHRIQGAVAKYAERKGVSEAAVNKKLNRLFEQAARVDDPARREALIARFVRANPELQPIMDALDDIAAMSKRIVQERAKDPRPFTEAELRKYGAIIKNRYAYFTRTYAAFQGKEGDKRNQQLLKEWAIAKKLKEKGKELPPSYRHSFEIYERAVRFVINNDLAVFDPGMLAAQKMDKLMYLYETWVGDITPLKNRIEKDKTIKGIVAKRKALRAAAEDAIAVAGKNLDPDKIRREAEWIVNGMLGMHEASNPVITYYRGFKEDTGILQKRELVPEDIRNLFGEVDDLATRVAITLAKQGELAARMRMLREIYESGEGKWFVSPETFRSSDEYASFTEELSGEQWGPLNGMRVKPTIAAAINDGLDIFTPLSTALSQSHASVDRAVEASSMKAVAGVRNLASLSKYMNIVLDVANTWINLIGSAGIMVQNGVTSPQDVSRAIGAAVAMIGDQATPGRMKIAGVEFDALQRNADLELFLKYGLLDSAVGQELRSTPIKMLKELVVAMNEDSTGAGVRKVLHKIGKVAGRAKGTITEGFALSDAWVKPAVFLGRLRFLEKLNQAEGNGWTQEQMERMAADMTKDTTITFQRAAPIVKMVERVPLAQYAPYMQGVFRSVFYSYAQAYKDFLAAVNAKTDEGRMLYAIEGGRRLTGATAATVGLAFLTRGLQAFFNDDDDESMIEAATKFLFPDFRYGHSLYLGKDNKDNPVFFTLSRFDPLGPFNDMLRILASDDEPGAKTRAIVEHMKDLWIKPRILTDMANVTRAMFSDNEDVKNKKGKIERLFPQATNYMKGIIDSLPGLDYEDGEAIVQVIDGLTPGMLDALDSDNAWPTKDQDANEKVMAMLLLYTGGRLQAADPERAAFMAGNDLEKYQREGRAVINEALDVRGYDAAIERFYELRDGEIARYDRLREVFVGMLDYGYTPQQAMKIMRDNKVQAQDIAMLLQGRNMVGTGLLNVDSIVKAGELQDKNLPAEERAQRALERRGKLLILKQLLDKERTNE